MDHQLVPSHIEYDELEKVPGMVGPDEQEARRVVMEFESNDCVYECVLDVIVGHAMATSR